jgi:hypothetical protein
MAKSKGALDSIKANLGDLASRIPFAKRSTAATPEPFSSIEDDTPLGDLLSSQNVAPVAPASKSGRELPDLRGILASTLSRKPVLIGILGGLALILIIAVVAVAVSVPPKAPEEAAPFTKEGTALVKTWLLPPGDPLEPRMEMQRGGASAYKPEDAVKLGRPSDPGTATDLAAKNDEAIDDLYGTVP